MNKFKMNKALMALSAMAVISASAPCLGSTYDFSFTGSLGTVTGEIDGLSPGYTGPASAIYIDSAPAVFGLSNPPVEFFLTEPPNNFVVDAAGNVTSYDLFAEFEAYIQLNLSSDCLSCNNLQFPGTTIIDTAVSFPFPNTSASTTPIPTSATLFATVLGLLALIAHRRKQGIRTNMQAA